MSKLLQIEDGLRMIDAASFQRLGEAYLYRRGYGHPHQIGLVLGGSKTRIGTPDTLLPESDGRYVFAEYTTQISGLEAKLDEDLGKCLDEGKTGIPVARIREIVLCYTAPLPPDAVHRLAERCRAHGIAPHLVSSGELAHALHAEFPALALEFLGVQADTGQVLPIEEFVAASTKNTLTTPLDTDFRFRDKDLETAASYLESSAVLLIGGRPGVGKSRLALEVARRYGDAHPGAQIRCIVHRGSDLFEDLQAYFRSPGHYLLLVDDANRLSRFEYVLNLLTELRADRTIKILATVRDYALQPTEDEARRHTHPAVMTIERLSDEEVRTLVAEETGVTAYAFLSLITQIAQGNPRLALMAARVVTETGSGAALADISALYDEYYRSIRRDLNLALDPELLLAAGVVAFFRQVDRTNTEQMAVIERAFGLTSDALWSAVRKLHEIEAVDLYENEVVKVADQVLATYLLFLAMFRERVLKVRVLLDNFFPRLRHRVVDALNPMFAVFDTDKLVETLTTEVREARAAMLARGDDEAALHALDLFWFALPSDALQYVEAFIAGLPKAMSPATDFRESHDAMPVPSALSILSRFARAAPELRRTALQLVARYAERDPAAVPHLVRIVREDYGIEPDSPGQGYAAEHAVLEALLTESDEGRKPGATGLLLAYVQSLLKTHIQRTSGTRNGIQIVRFDLPDTPELARLRQRAWEVVGLALRGGRNREAALALLRAHASSGYEVGNADIVTQDAELVIPLLREHVNLEVYAEVSVAHAYFGHTRRVGLTVPPEVLAHFTTPAVEAAALVMDDWLDRRELGYEEYREEKERRIAAFVKDADESAIADLLRYCLVIRSTLADSHDQWQLDMGVHQVLRALASCNQDLFVTTVFDHLHQGNPLGVSPRGLTGALVGILGPQAAMDRLCETSCPTRNHWLSSYFLDLPADAISPRVAERLLQHYRSTPSAELVADLDHVLHYEGALPGTLWAVIELLTERADQQKDLVAGRLLAHALSYGDIHGRLGELFQGNVPLLERMYLAACRAAGHTDANAEAFDVILSFDAGFAERWVAGFMAGKTTIDRHQDNRDYTRLWQRADYQDVAKRFVEAGYREGRGKLSFEPYPLVLFRMPEGLPNELELASRQDAVLDELIRDRQNDPEMMRFLFELVAHLPVQRRPGRLATLFQVNTDPALFRSLSLEPHMRMAHGSWVPVLQKDIEYFESLLPLCGRIELLPHRQILEGRLASLREELAREKRSDFMDDD